MAAFSHCSFLLSPFSDQPLIINSTPLHHLPPTHHTSSNETICTDTNQSSRMMTINDIHNEPSLTKTHSPAHTSVVAPVKLENPDDNDDDVAQKKMKKKKNRAEYRNGSSKQEGTEGRNKKQKKGSNRNGNGAVKKEEKPKISLEPPKGFIHVRARRGEATDSHSLAERVRREKISERMRMLQRLVPGCDKVTGKALVLDEIINYVQSLQNQVEFLSMKLASLNPTMFEDFTMGQDTFMGTPDTLNSSVASPLLPSVPQCSTNNQATNFADDYSATVFLQGEKSNTVFTSLDVVGELWDAAEEQRQNFPNPSDFFNTNLWSFQC